MPTKDQFQELIDGTNYTWISINGVNGGKLTSKKNSDMYIFLPAGGYWSNMSLYDVGTNGYYWTTKYDHSPWSWYINCNSSHIYSSNQGTWQGFSVRAIK